MQVDKFIIKLKHKEILRIKKLNVSFFVCKKGVEYSNGEELSVYNYEFTFDKVADEDLKESNIDEYTLLEDN